MATTKEGVNTIIAESGDFAFVSYLALLLGRSRKTPTETLHRVSHTASLGTTGLEVTRLLPLAREVKQQ